MIDPSIKVLKSSALADPGCGTQRAAARRRINAIAARYVLVIAGVTG